MAVIIVQVGQCGNQVGTSIYNTIYKDCFDNMNNDSKNDSYSEESMNKYFYQSKVGSYTARSICIDMEEKVVMRESSNVKNNKWDYCPHSRCCQKQGSGNNWASGYYKGAEKLLKPFDDIMRKQMERCDSVEAILLTMSVAGGTGSGLGSRLTRNIKEEYSGITVANHCVWPYSRGEVSVQSYNALLSTASLLGQGEDGLIDDRLSTDALFIHENDALQAACLSRLGSLKIGVEDLNRLISHQLVSCLQPVRETKLPLSDLVLELVPHPDYRFVKLRNVPYLAENCKEFTTDTWSQLLRHVNQMMRTESIMEDGMDWSERVISAPYLCKGLILRGKGCSNLDVTSLLNTHGSNNLPISTWHHTRPYVGYEKCVTAVTNGRDSVASLRNVVSKAWNMFSQGGAFLYQYERFGVTKSHFFDCFANIEQVIHNYDQL